MTRDEYIANFTHLAFFLVNMKGKTRGRDDTITLALTYDNFTDYYESNKHMFLVKFASLDSFLVALLRNFFIVRVSCVTHEPIEGKRDELLDMFNEIATTNLEALKARLLKIHAITYRKIEEHHGP